MFRGLSSLSIDSKGRIAIPSRHRERLAAMAEGCLVLTLSPLDQSLWLYPLPEWEIIEAKLAELSDFETQSRRTKQMMRGYASDCQLDGQGRILLPQELRDYAGLSKDIILLGQGNKFELWDADTWNDQRQAWLRAVSEGGDEPSDALRSLSL